MARTKATTKRENPRLMLLERKDGYTSVYLEYYLGRKETPVTDDNGKPVYYTDGVMAGKPKYRVTHERKKEKLELKFKTKPTSTEEREEKKEVLEKAKAIRKEREQRFLQNKNGYRLKKKVVDFISYFQTYIRKYKLRDIGMMIGVQKRFVDFLNDTPYNNMCGKDDKTGRVKMIHPNNLTQSMMKDFALYLQSRGKGEGANSYFARFKKFAEYAVKDGVLAYNPCDGVKISVDRDKLKKDILDEDEIRLLAQTHYKGESEVIRRAFMFSLFAGVRFCDVKDLTFENVDSGNMEIVFVQSKVKKRSKKSEADIPLNEMLLKLIGKPRTSVRERIFPLPSYAKCIRELKKWVEVAGIKKHITWHCARHSFASNILDKGASVATIAELLGHSSLQYTGMYIQAKRQRKKDAINSLDSVEI